MISIRQDFDNNIATQLIGAAFGATRHPSLYYNTPLDSDNNYYSYGGLYLQLLEHGTTTEEPAGMNRYRVDITLSIMQISHLIKASNNNNKSYMGGLEVTNNVPRSLITVVLTGLSLAQG